MACKRNKRNRISADEIAAELAKCMAEEPPPIDSRARARWLRARSGNVLDRQLRALVMKAREAGVTGYAFERDAGIDKSSLVRWLRGEQGLNMRTASLLAEYFGVELKPKT